METAESKIMYRLSSLSPYIFKQLASILSVLITIIVFRVYLLPNTVPTWFDEWRVIQVYHFGFNNLFDASKFFCVLAYLTWGAYYFSIAKSKDAFKLWLAVGVWITINVFSVLCAKNNILLLARDTNLLLGYISGLLVVRVSRRLDNYITMLIAFGSAQSIAAILYHSNSTNVLTSGTVLRAGGTFNSPAELYLVPLFILPLAVQKAISSKKNITTVFYFLTGSSMLAALILTWERSGFVSVCFGIFYIVRKFVSGKKQWLYFVLVLMLIFGVIYVRSNGPVNYASSNRSIQGRLHLFETGMLIFSHHVLDGVGVGRLSIPVPVTFHGHTENIQMIQPYNQLLYFLDEVGIIGGLLSISTVVFVYKVMYKSQSSIKEGVSAVWISILIAGLFNTLFSYDELSCGNMLIGSILGITMRISENDEASYFSHKDTDTSIV